MAAGRGRLHAASSPGRFPGLAAARGLTDLTNVPRFARNPRIARVMADLAYGQELGEGCAAWQP